MSGALLGNGLLASTSRLLLLFGAGLRSKLDGGSKMVWESHGLRGSCHLLLLTESLRWSWHHGVDKSIEHVALAICGWESNGGLWNYLLNSGVLGIVMNV